MQDYKREEYKVFELFDKKWALVTAGNIQHYNCCTVSWGSLGNIWGTAGNSRSTVTVYVHPARYTSEVLKESDILLSVFIRKPAVRHWDISDLIPGGMKIK